VLIKIKDTKDVERWVNPSYIRVVRGKKAVTEIWVQGMATPILVSHSADEVAAVVNAAGAGDAPYIAENDDVNNGTDVATFLTLLS